MIFFTKIEFKSDMNGFKFLGQKNLPYELHQLVENLQQESSSHQRILWRFEELKDRMPFVLVQTDFSPNIERLQNKTSSLKILKDEILFESINFSPNIREKFLFKIRANPTKTVDKKRIPVGRNYKQEHLAKEEKELLNKKQKEEISKWLKNKEIQHGFSILEYDFFNEEICKINICKTKKITAEYNSILFSGSLVIDDPKKFMHAVVNGIGSAKGFGFGLLSIKKN